METTVPGHDVVITEDAPASRLVYVIQKAPEVAIQVTEEQPMSPKRWPVFVAGMATALILSAATAFGRQVAHRPDKATLPMAVSVAWAQEANITIHAEGNHLGLPAKR